VLVAQPVKLSRFGILFADLFPAADAQAILPPLVVEPARSLRAGCLILADLQPESLEQERAAGIVTAFDEFTDYSLEILDGKFFWFHFSPFIKIIKTAHNLAQLPRKSKHFLAIKPCLPYKYRLWAGGQPAVTPYRSVSLTTGNEQGGGKRAGRGPGVTA
jgi:hypothetical protein